MAERKKPMEVNVNEAYGPAEAKQLTAIYVDSYWITIWSGHIRITFGEVFGDKTEFRSAVVIPLDVVESLTKDIVELVNKQIAEDKEEEKNK
jgi:hypothetical protein